MRRNLFIVPVNVDDGFAACGFSSENANTVMHFSSTMFDIEWECFKYLEKKPYIGYKIRIETCSMSQSAIDVRSTNKF